MSESDVVSARHTLGFAPRFLRQASTVLQIGLPLEIVFRNVSYTVALKVGINNNEMMLAFTILKIFFLNKLINTPPSKAQIEFVPTNFWCRSAHLFGYQSIVTSSVGVVITFLPPHHLTCTFAYRESASKVSGV